MNTLYIIEECNIKNKLITSISFTYLFVHLIKSWQPSLADDIVEGSHLVLVGQDVHEAGDSVVVGVPPLKEVKK